MVKIQRRLLVAPVGAVIGLSAVLSACTTSATGSGSPAAFPRTSTPPTTSSAPTPTPSLSSSTASSGGTPDGQAKLATIVLQPSDLPTGWTGAAYTPDPDESTDNANLTKCAGSSDTTPDKVAEAHSQDYSSDDATISSQAISYRSMDDINTDVALLHNPKIASCYQQLVQSGAAGGLPAGATVEGVTINVSAGQYNGPSNVVGTLTGKIIVNLSGQSVTVYLNSAFITGPLIEAEVDFDNIGSPVDAALQTRLINIVAARAAAG